MILDIFSKMQACSFDSDTGKWSCASFSRKGKRRVFSRVSLSKGPEHQSSRCRVYASVHSRNANLVVANFPKMKSDLLRLQVEEKLRQEALVSSELALDLGLKVADSSGSSQRIVAVGVPSEDTDPLLDTAAAAKGSMRVLVPCFMAVSGLIGALTAQPVLAIVCRADSMELVVAKAGLAWMHQVIPLPSPEGIKESLEHDLISQTIEQIRPRCSMLFNFEPSRIICFGIRPSECPKRIGGTELWRPDFSELLALQEPDDFYMYPEVIGTPLADPNFNLIPQSWRISFRLQGAVAASAAVMAAAGMVLGGSALALHHRNQDLMARYSAKYQQLSSQAEALAARIPAEDLKRQIEMVAGIKEASAREPKPHEILLALGSLLPKKVKIEAFSVNRQMPPDREISGAGRQARGGAGAVYQTASSQRGLDHGIAPQERTGGAAGSRVVERLLETPLHVSLDLVVKGGFGLSKTLFRQSIASLSEQFKVTYSHWSYNESSSRAEMRVDLMVPKKDAANRHVEEEGAL